MTTKERDQLQKELSLLIKKQQKEYSTRGNTQYCQELFVEITQIKKKLGIE